MYVKSSDRSGRVTPHVNAYVDNLDYPEFSEFGRICICPNGLFGSLLRID